MGLKISADGTETVVLPADNKEFTLDELYDLIGCSMVQMIYLPSGKTMWLDEEGKMKEGAMINEVATLKSGLYPHDVIVGNALILEEGEIS